MNQSLDELASIINHSSKRNLFTWLLRWTIGFAMVAAITLYFDNLEWLWIVAISIALLSLGVNLYVRRVLNRAINEANVTRQTLERMLVPEDEALASLIIGKWRLETVHEGHQVTGTTQYNEDHTLFSSGSVSTHGNVETFEVEGQWHVEGRELVWSVVKSSNHELVPVGLTQREQILSITEDTKTYQDEEGTVWAEQRERRSL